MLRVFWIKILFRTLILKMHRYLFILLLLNVTTFSIGQQFQSDTVITTDQLLEDSNRHKEQENINSSESGNDSLDAT